MVFSSRTPVSSIHIATVIANRPIITGIMVVHFPFGPSIRIIIEERKIPNIKIPLNAVSGAPFPKKSEPGDDLLFNSVKQPSPPIE